MASKKSAQKQPGEQPAPIWEPDPDEVALSQISDFMDFVEARAGVKSETYTDLWQWSIDDLEGFWSAIWDYFSVISGEPYGQVLGHREMPGARWFTGATVNYAEHALRAGLDDDLADTPALIAIAETQQSSQMSWRELRRQVGAAADWLREQGVRKGDRAVGYLPSTEHAVGAFLASASIGAVWSVCAQDYGAAGAAARLGQLEPAVLFAADGYRWVGEEFDRRSDLIELQRSIPSLRATVLVSHLGSGPVDGAVPWSEIVSGTAEPCFERVDFDDPLWVLFSSGTTGNPKGIVHAHGGVILDHLRLHGLHNDLRVGDRFFWYTTTNWMMWNLVVSSLLTGATVILYDGSPVHPGPGRLWEIAAEHRVAMLGTSPGYLIASMKAGLEPARDQDLSVLQTIGCTGAPLPPQCYFWVRDHVGDRLQVCATSGGTDVVSGFAGAAPNTAIWPGEISAPLLGVALAAWSDQAEPVVDRVGELVVTQPMPTMPIYFWDDPDEQLYLDAYFSVYPGVCSHGDRDTLAPAVTVN